MSKQDRDKMWAEFQFNREMHQQEVAFIRANPIYTQAVGERKAAEFIAHLTEATDWMEKYYNKPGNEASPMPKWDEDTPAHYAVEVFFTPEQKAIVAALHARMDLVEMRSKAESYDDLLEALERSGLSPDAVQGEDGKLVDVIAIEDYELAAAWFRNAIVYDDDDEG